jgi:hypothetical protein
MKNMNVKVADLDIKKLEAVLGVKIELYNGSFLETCCICTRVPSCKINDSLYCDEHGVMNLYLRYKWLEEGY